jgi:hypothetical protein
MVERISLTESKLHAADAIAIGSLLKRFLHGYREVGIPDGTAPR